MNIVLIIAGLSVLVSLLFFRNFFAYKKKVDLLEDNGIDAPGELMEVRNLGMQNNQASRLNEVAIRFTKANGKDHVVRLHKSLTEGEIIEVGSKVGVTYLESDPNICNIFSLDHKAKYKWSSLIWGLVVLLGGLFIAYVVFVNIGTV